MIVPDCFGIEWMNGKCITKCEVWLACFFENEKRVAEEIEMSDFK